MSRKLMRVPMDFAWPIKQVWKGYINPIKSQQCKQCDGSGLNKPTKELNDSWYSFDKVEYINLPNGRRYNNAAWRYHLTEIEVSALLENERLRDFDGKVPSPEEVNEWAKTGFGHDSINRWICVEARAKHLGIHGYCEICNGEGVLWASPEIKKAHDEWEKFDPPTGPGFQLWGTTNEGEPQSPVFSSLELLCEWCAENATTFGSNKTDKENWKKMLSDGFVFYEEDGRIFI